MENGNCDKKSGLGLLILRVGIGAMFMTHGYGKLVGGPEMWGKVGGAVSNFGIHFAPTFFGLMAALSEFGGGLCLILGLFFRPACFFMLCTMIVASTHHFVSGDGLQVASHAIEDGIVFLSLMLIGPGQWSLNKKMCSNGRCSSSDEAGKK